jgi:proteasome lid subunit RPN8/RPN11
MALYLPRSLADTLRDYARRQMPIEACGVLGYRGLDLIWTPMRNVRQSPRWFAFDPVEQLRVWRDYGDMDYRVGAIFHSHPQTSARPTQTDARFAAPHRGVAMLIYSVVEDDLRAWRMVAGVPVEDTIHGA